MGLAVAFDGLTNLPRVRAFKLLKFFTPQLNEMLLLIYGSRSGAEQSAFRLNRKHFGDAQINSGKSREFKCHRKFSRSATCKVHSTTKIRFPRYFTERIYLERRKLFERPFICRKMFQMILGSGRVGGRASLGEDLFNYFTLLLGSHFYSAANKYPVMQIK